MIHHRATTQTHYCHDADCDGWHGFTVTWAPDSETEPSYPLRDTCPHCGGEMHDTPVNEGVAAAL